MSSLTERIKKNSRSKVSNFLGKVKLPDNKASTAAYAINIALEGDLNGAIRPGHLLIAGDSRHFKTSIALVCAKAWMDKYPEGALLFIDTEFGASEEYFASCGIDTDRVLHVPVSDIEEIKFELSKQLDALEKDDKLIVIVDSLGGAASRKEAEDADRGHSAQDMGLRAKAINSMWRVLTPKMKMTGTPIITINHIYDGDHHQKIISGGRKVLLSADDAWIISRRQEKEGTEVKGYAFIINVEKSRKVREKSKIPLYVSFDGGILTHRPLVDIATETGWMVSPSKGWRCIVDPETGEVIGNNFRERDAYEPEFWTDLIKNPKFNESIRKRYRLGENALLRAAEKEQEELEEIIEDEGE